MATVLANGQIKLNNGTIVKGEDNGWYDAQNFSGGVLGAPGVKISPGVGQGQAVSNEVIAQTSPNNVAYVQQQKQQAAPGSAGGVQASLDAFSSKAFGAASSVATPGVQSLAEIAKGIKDAGLLPSGEAPQAPNLLQSYQELSTAQGVPAIQTTINDLKAQQDAIASQLQVTKTAEKGKPVAQNVIEGRVSQEQQVAQDQYDFIGRQLARKNDELTTALGTIKTIMDLTQQDYTNASQAYATQFTQAMATINLVQGIQQDQKTDAQRATDNARANLQIYTNAITNGNLDVNSLDPAQQAQLNTLEVQAGLPVGFVQSLKMDPKANIISTTTNNGVTQVLIKNPDGTVSVQNYGTKTGSAADNKTSDANATQANATAQVKAGATLDWLVTNYVDVPGGISIEQAYSLYNSNSPYGHAVETLDQVKNREYSTNPAPK